MLLGRDPRRPGRLRRGAFGRRSATGLGVAAALAVIALQLARVFAVRGRAALPAGSADAARGGPDPAATTRIDLKPRPSDAVFAGRGDLPRLGPGLGLRLRLRLDEAGPAPRRSGSASGGFGKQVAYVADGKIYAQPLYVPKLTIDDATYEVVVVATWRDSVYAFDTDATSPAAKPLRRASLLPSGARTFDGRFDPARGGRDPGDSLLETVPCSPSTIRTRSRWSPATVPGPAAARRGLSSSATDPARDGLHPGEFDHFTVPPTADGLVIIGDQGHLEIHGMLRG